jgi:hypothetical protein
MPDPNRPSLAAFSLLASERLRLSFIQRTAALDTQRTQDVHLICADSLACSDFCLGDTGAILGHSQAIATFNAWLDVFEAFLGGLSAH